jgi:hypothetical protein
MKVFLDDIRQPYDDSWVLARSVNDFKHLVINNKITEISFDHDLGEKDGQELPTGFDAVNWMVSHALDEPGTVYALEKITVHSSNPPGADNIVGLIINASKHGILPKQLLVVKQPFESRI